MPKSGIYPPPPPPPRIIMIRRVHRMPKRVILVHIHTSFLNENVYNEFTKSYDLLKFSKLKSNAKKFALQ